MRDFLINALTVLGLIVSGALGVAIGWRGTWLSVAVLTLLCLVVVLRLEYLESAEKVQSEWWYLWYAYSLTATILAWAVAVVAAPLVRLLHNGAIRIGTDQFVR